MCSPFVRIIVCCPRCKQFKFKVFLEPIPRSVDYLRTYTDLSCQTVRDRWGCSTRILIETGYVHSVLNYVSIEYAICTWNSLLGLKIRRNRMTAVATSIQNYQLKEALFRSYWISVPITISLNLISVSLFNKKGTKLKSYRK
jgi:hypothetical protein